MASITYRYICPTEAAYVYETRLATDAAPTQCVNSGAHAAITDLAIIDSPQVLRDVTFSAGAYSDFTGNNIVGLSHASLDDVGTHTHAQIDAHLLSTANPHSVTKAQVGLGNVQNLLDNLAATTNPGAGNDATQGYAVGSRWINTSADREYVCVDSSAAAAVWRRTDLADHADLASIGSNSHAQIDTHIADATLHRVINDAGTSATELWSASKVSTELATKSALGHTHAAADVTDFAAAADARIAAQKGAANGLATLDGSSKIPSSQLPALAITSVSVVADIAARDALAPQEGDVAKVSNSDGAGHPQTYIYDGAAWVDIQETSDVISVNGKTGTVVLSTTDVAEGTNLYYSEARVSANASVAASTTHSARTDNPHAVTKAQVGLGNVENVKVSLGAAVDPSASDDAAAGYAVGSSWLNTSADRAFVCLDSSNGAAVWRSTTGGHLPLCVNATTSNTAYTVVSSFLFPGASVRGIAAITAVSKAGGADAYKIRITNLGNNSAEICKDELLSGQTTHTTTFAVNAGNVPSTDQIFEVWLAAPSAMQKPTLYAINIQYL